MTARLDARDALLASISERDFQPQVLRQAAGWGWLCWHNVVAWKSGPGFLDLLLLRRGRLVIAELKTMCGKLTPKQREWLMAWWESGKAEVYVWNPSYWYQVTEVLLPEGLLVVK